MVGNRFINEIGNKYGYLLVIKEAGRGKYGSVMWLCKCDCGNKVIIRGKSLRKGQKSCGCYSKEVNNKRLLIDETGNIYNRL